MDARNMPAPMSLSRARKIVAFAEKEFASGRRVDDAFTPFSGGGAITRLEAVQALFIGIADYFQITHVKEKGTPGAIQRFDRYASLSGPIAWGILCDNITDSTAVPAALGNCETVESFVVFLRSLNPRCDDFWPRVYHRIGASQ